METLAILTFCDGSRRLAPFSQVLLTRWELSVLGYALHWPIPEGCTRLGGHYLAAAAQRYQPVLAAVAATAIDVGEPWITCDVIDEPDTGISDYWLTAEQVQQIFANLSDRHTRDAIVAYASADWSLKCPPDRLINCLQMLSQAVDRGEGLHFAHYLC